MKPFEWVLTFVFLSLMIGMARTGHQEALDTGVPPVAITNWHGEKYGGYQIRGSEKDDRIMVVGTPGFDDSFCAFEIRHPNSVIRVGGLTLCRCDQILYNKDSPKSRYDTPNPEPWRATDSQSFKDQTGWTDTSLAYIESTACKPGPCCHENVTETPVLPAGVTPNYRRKIEETSTVSFASTATTDQVKNRNDFTLGPGAVAGIAIGVVVMCATGAGGTFWYLKKKRMPRKRSSANKTEKETA